MAPVVPPLAQSESKARFFARLGLDPTNGTHRRVYNLMKMEAAEGRKRLLESQNGSTAQIHETAWQREVMRIHDSAQIQTRAVYKFGHDTQDSDYPDNWIIRWMLWHVFRYRDYRNKSRPERGSREGSNEMTSEGDDNSEARTSPAVPSPREAPIPSQSPVERKVEPTSPSPRTYWDPVRNT